MRGTFAGARGCSQRGNLGAPDRRWPSPLSVTSLSCRLPIAPGAPCYVLRVPARILAAAALTFSLARPHAVGAQELGGDATDDPPEKSKGSSHNLAFTIVPGPTYNPSLGWGLMVIPLAMYDVDPEDKVSPGSTTGLFGLATTNGSWAAGFQQKLYLAQDTWRLKAMAGVVSVNQRFYGYGGNPGSNFINMTMEAGFATAEGLYKVLPGAYAGLQLAYRQSRFLGQGSDASAILDAAGINQTWVRNFLPALRFDYDTRDSQTAPWSGLLTEFTFKGASEALGSSNSYTRISVIYSQFHALDAPKHHVLAWNVNVQGGFGDVPFDEYPDVGGHKGLRGYLRGQFTDKNMVTAQAEWRWGFWHRMGTVLFAGVGKVFPAWDDIHAAELLPSVGFGLRFDAIPERRMHARFDFAWGKEGGTVYFSVGEAF